MSRQELEIKAKEFNSKLKRHPMSSEELQKVLCDFAEALQIQDVSVQSEQFVCNHITHQELLNAINVARFRKHLTPHYPNVYTLPMHNFIF